MTIGLEALQPKSIRGRKEKGVAALIVLSDSLVGRTSRWVFDAYGPGFGLWDGNPKP